MTRTKRLRAAAATAACLVLSSPTRLASSSGVGEWSYVPPLYECSPTSSSCSSPDHECLANPNHPQRTTDAECAPCQKDQAYWPCDVDNLCYCWDKTRPQIPPAPSTRLYNGGEGLEVSDVDPCDIVTREVFDEMAPEAEFPYSYGGFCSAVRKYNENHPREGVFNMGGVERQKAELAAFFGNGEFCTKCVSCPRLVCDTSR